MRKVKLTKESTKDILENLLKRSPNNYGKFEDAVADILTKVRAEGDAALFEYTKEFDMVIDPMSGSGTTVLEALLSNRNCRAYDVNPLSVLLAKVKVTHISRTTLEAVLDSICEKYKPLSLDEFD